MNTTARKNAPDWDEFARLETAQRNALDAMLALLRETEESAADEVRTGWIGLISRNPFGIRTAQIAERKSAAEKLPAIRKRIHELNATLRDCEARRDAALHEWLLRQDAEYAKAAELRALQAQLCPLLLDLAFRLESLAVEYGRAKAQVAGASRAPGADNPAADELAEIHRLHTVITTIGGSLAPPLSRFNALAASPLFEEIRLDDIPPIREPRFDTGASSETLRTGLDAGEALVRQALDRLAPNVRSIQNKDRLETLLRHHRDSVWRYHLNSGILNDEHFGGLGGIA